jgi:hypothetical protein
MIDEIEVYQTNDGLLHRTLEKAQKHELDKVCELFDERLKPLQDQGKISAIDKFRIVVQIAGTHEELYQLYKQIKKILADKPLKFNK